MAETAKKEDNKKEGKDGLSLIIGGIFILTLVFATYNYFNKGRDVKDGTDELYDTFGFPIDLTQLMARESGKDVDMDGFHKCLEQQKERSRAAGSMDTDDWVVLRDESGVEFVGYDEFECDCVILKYRKVKSKNKVQYQLVLNKTPFYAESGGQIGDTGSLVSANEKIIITDTQKENNLIIHFCERL